MQKESKEYVAPSFEILDMETTQVVAISKANSNPESGGDTEGTETLGEETIFVW